MPGVDYLLEMRSIELEIKKSQCLMRCWLNVDQETE